MNDEHRRRPANGQRVDSQALTLSNYGRPEVAALPHWPRLPNSLGQSSGISGTAYSLGFFTSLAFQSGSTLPVSIAYLATSSMLVPEIPQVQTKVERAVEALDEWLADESGYDEETWPELKRSLDEHRLSERRLFGD